MTIYEFIITKLKENNKSVNWLNNQAGLSSATIYRLKTKKDYTINLETAIKIADVLDFSLDDLRNLNGNTR